MSANWHYFLTESEADEFGRREADIRRCEWHGPGWYWAEYSTQRCPRNCCYDSVVTLEYATKRTQTIRDEMRELAEKLKEAKDKQHAPGYQPDPS
jgi:hypothetical protein